MTWLQPAWVQTLIQAIQALAAVLGLLVGHRALRTWTQQLQGQHQGQGQQVFINLPRHIPEDGLVTEEDQG